MGQVIQLPSAHKRMYGIEKRVNLLGRSEENDVVLSGDRTISRQHAIIGYDEQIHRYYLTDCKSQNGTALNGHRVGGRTLLSHGDEVRIGCTILTFWTGAGKAWLEMSEPVADQINAEPDDLPTYSMQGVRVLHGQKRSLFHKILNVISLGRK